MYIGAAHAAAEDARSEAAEQTHTEASQATNCQVLFYLVRGRGTIKKFNVFFLVASILFFFFVFFVFLSNTETSVVRIETSFEGSWSTAQHLHLLGHFPAGIS